MAPPVFNKPDPITGVPKKSVYGPWMMKAFGVLARMRRFRGTGFDFFGRTAERKMERALIVEYETVVAEIIAKLTPQNHGTAVDLASVPEHIRGYGHVKERASQDGEGARSGVARAVPLAVARARAGGDHDGGLAQGSRPAPILHGQCAFHVRSLRAPLPDPGLPRIAARPLARRSRRQRRRLHTGTRARRPRRVRHLHRHP